MGWMEDRERTVVAGAERIVYVSDGPNRARRVMSLGER